MTGEICIVISSQNCLGKGVLKPPDENSASVSSSKEVANGNKKGHNHPAPQKGAS